MSENYSFDRDYSLDSLKIPPNSIQAEQSVLGGLMLDNQTWDSVADKVVESDFYRKDHRLIFRTIEQLAEKQIPFDIITISEALEAIGELENVGGLSYLGMLARDTPSAANIVTYANIVRDRSVLRQLIHVGTNISDSAFNTEGRDTADLLEQAEREVFKIAEQRQRGQGGFVAIKALLAKAVDRIEMLFEQEGSITGAATGFTDFDQLTSGLQPADLIIVAGRPSMGKCFGKGTPILMYSGEVKAVEEIQAGDLLMGDDSTPRRVLSLARGREPMYWVRQNKALDYRVNESHILSLKRSRNEGRHQNGDVLNIALTDYLSASTKFQSNYKGYKVAIDFAPQELPLCPYFLGLWLGDGTSASVDIATTDSEVIAYLRDYAERLNLHLTEKLFKDKDGNGKCPLYSIGSQQRGNHQNTFSLQKTLRELDLLNNKHIPHLFLANSRANRLQLLAGLIDSDGHYAPKYKMVEITQKNLGLAKQIKFLCDSLGFRTSLIEKQAVIKSTGYQGMVYQVRFSGDLSAIPVKVERKKAAAWTSNRTWQQTGIRIEYDKTDDYYGFVCDGNRLFLLEDMTVVHNTTIAMNMAEHIAIKGDKPVAVFSMEMPGDSLAMRMMSSLGRIDQHRIRTGKLEDDEWPRLTSAINLLAETKLFIDDTPALTPTEVRSRARRLVREHGPLGLIVLDYLQLMQSPSSGDNRVQQISDISRGLKALAKELNVPVVALSQLNRNLEQRPNKRPVMSDLRECVTGDTLVMLADGRRLPIRDLVGQIPDVVSMTPDGQLQNAASDLVWSAGEKEIVKVTLAGGRTIRCSKQHRLRGLWDWVEAGRLKTGDRLAFARYLPEPLQPDVWPEHELVLLAHLIGDGSYVKQQPLRYTTASEANSRAVTEAALAFSCTVTRHAGRGQWHQLVISGNGDRWHPKGVGKWLKDLGIFGQRSRDKHLPEGLFKLGNSQLALFLRHLWATDGCIYTGTSSTARSRIYFASVSERLVHDVAALLLRFGIVARIRRVISANSAGWFTADISGVTQQRLFLTAIGAFGAQTAQAERLLARLENQRDNTNVDTLPGEVFAYIREQMRQSGISHRQMASLRGTAYGGSAHFNFDPSRKTLQHYADILNDERLQTLANNALFWDRVVAVEPAGVAEVFDLTVPGNACWLADGIVSHNSGAIEQDADLIVFVYRDEVYNEDSPDKGIAEVIIGKQRNGPLGTVRLTFLGQYTRFENFAGNSYSDGGYE